MKTIHKFSFFIGCFCFPLFTYSANTNPLSQDLHHFKKKLTKIVQNISRTAHISIRVETLGDAQVLYSHEPSRLLIPASAVKVLTTAHALDVLGPAHTVKTRFFITAPLRDGIVNGDLIVSGAGDPYLVSEHLWKVAREISRRGLREIKGSILINDSYFLDTIDTMTNFSPSRTYAAKITPINLNFNSAEIHITNVKGKNKPVIELGPVANKYAIFQNKVKIKKKGTTNIKVYSKGKRKNKELFYIEGVLANDSKPITIYHPVKNSPAYFSYALAALLEKEGIKVANSFGGLVKENKGNLLLEWESLPLTDIVKLYNTYSNNVMADQIFYLIGAHIFGPPASKEKAFKAVHAYLKQTESCSSNDIKITNGSGLSWSTRISSKCLVDLLQKSYKKFHNFADLLGSFPIGARTGTLKDRFRSRKGSFSPISVRAKTGTLFRRKGVTAMVGFTSNPSGKVIVFSILINRKKGHPAEIFRLRKWEESIIEILQLTRVS